MILFVQKKITQRKRKCAVLPNISNQIKNSIFSTSITEYSNFLKKKHFKWNQIVTITYKEKICM